MGKIILSYKILKENFMNVAFEHADNFCKKLNLNKSKIIKELNLSKDLNLFIETYHKYFGEEIKLIL